MVKFYRDPDGNLIEIKPITAVRSFPSNPNRIWIVLAEGGSVGISVSSDLQRRQVMADIEKYWGIRPVNKRNPIAAVVRWAMPNLFGKEA